MVFITPLIFLIAAVLIIGALVATSMTSVQKAIWIAAIACFAALAYYAAPGSIVSPFTARTDIPFGASDHALVIAAVAGSLAGAIASPFLARSSSPIRARDIIQALIASPITIVPILQSLQQTPDPTWFSIVLAFALAYQSAAFWYKMLEK